MYASHAQRRKFHALLAQGKISKATVEEFDRASKGKKLPERVKKSRPREKRGALLEALDRMM